MSNKIIIVQVWKVRFMDLQPMPVIMMYVHAYRNCPQVYTEGI